MRAFPNALFLLTVALFQVTATRANTDVIRLDMGPVRGPATPATRKYPLSAAPPRIPPEQDPDVFCTDGEFLDDVFCDMRRFYGSNMWKSRSAPDVYDFEVDYPDSRRRGVVCTASFERPNRTEAPLRLPFYSFKCEGGEEDREAGLPPFRMSTAAAVRIILRKPDDYHFNCPFVFNRAGGSVQSASRAGAKRPRVVRFHFAKYGCVSPVVLDRETTVGPGGSPCETDGRRCRPKNK